MANLKIDYHNVEISAVSDYCADPKDTFYLLNELSIMAGDAAAAMDVKGYSGLADRYRRIKHQLYQACEDSGFYKEVVK